MTIPSAHRLVPDRPLPSYTHVPGQTPHPRHNPGHLFYQRPAEPVQPLSPSTWQTNGIYLYGIDLFNHGFFWEAHEVWEELWHAAGRRGPLADFLKSLIKLAAAGVKHLEGRPTGVASHCRRAAELWGSLPQDMEGFCGLRLGELIAVAEKIAREGWPEESPRLVPAAHKPDAQSKEWGSPLLADQPCGKRTPGE
jgi:hypothetical protein